MLAIWLIFVESKPTEDIKWDVIPFVIVSLCTFAFLTLLSVHIRTGYGLYPRIYVKSGQNNQIWAADLATSMRACSANIEAKYKRHMSHLQTKTDISKQTYEESFYIFSFYIYLFSTSVWLNRRWRLRQTLLLAHYCFLLALILPSGIYCTAILTVNQQWHTVAYSS